MVNDHLSLCSKELSYLLFDDTICMTVIYEQNPRTEPTLYNAYSIKEEKGKGIIEE